MLLFALMSHWPKDTFLYLEHDTSPTNSIVTNFVWYHGWKCCCVTEIKSTRKKIVVHSVYGNYTNFGLVCTIISILLFFFHFYIFISISFTRYNFDFCCCCGCYSCGKRIYKKKTTTTATLIYLLCMQTYGKVYVRTGWNSKKD
jgi:hypothetical protein